jgi:hypothetical protein
MLENRVESDGMQVVGSAYSTDESHESGEWKELA